MRKFFYVVVMLCVAMVFFTTGCKEKTTDVADTTVVDSTVVVNAIDTVKVDSVVEAAPMPKAADKLFADFFFDFISKKKVQLNRIKFPLKMTSGSALKLIQRGEWKMERFYQNQEYYTQVFDSEKQMKAVNKLSADTVIVEKIHLKEGVVEQYVFEHPDGKWMLTELKHVGLSESQNASFLAFLQKFFTDSEYQMSHVANPLPYYGPDPNGEDENKYVKTKIAAETWSEYVPEIPGDQIYNILYGQVYQQGNEKIFLFKGIANGLETQLKFQKQGNRWKLVKLSL